MTIACPTTKRTASEHNHTTAGAISLGVPIRPTSSCESACRPSSVSPLKRSIIGSRGFPILVADQDGVVLGFASYGNYRPWDGYLHTVEHSLYLHPDAQGRGVGGALLASLVERAETQGKHVMVAGIETSNAASIALHRVGSGSSPSLALSLALFHVVSRYSLL